MVPIPDLRTFSEGYERAEVSARRPCDQSVSG